MSTANSLFGTDMELHTVTRGYPVVDHAGPPLWKLLRAIWDLVPAMRGPPGIFCPYGRIYVDIGCHLEIATCECDSPYLLAVILEQAQSLLRSAVDAVRSTAGFEISLGNNNHSGLLEPGNDSTWGAHENYLIDVAPEELPADLVLPFLVTRFYQGSGAIEFPSGAFLAGSRAKFMTDAVGGTTHQHCRAIHSLARSEHHAGPDPHAFRYHLILGDGHPSMFNTALQFGATALTLKAILYDRKLKRSLPEFPGGGRWPEILQSLNRLAFPGQPPRVAPLAIRVQQAYLEACARCVDGLASPPPWACRLLCDWSDTLDAAARNDRDWLAARLDPFIKYEFFSSLLGEIGSSWSDLPGNRALCTELELLNQSYHEFTNPQSYFALLDAGGALKHRVADPLPPGAEPELYVPQTETRAKPRARFIIEHSHDKKLLMDWSEVFDLRHRRHKTLFDPFAADYSDWKNFDSEAAPVTLERILALTGLNLGEAGVFE